MQALEENYWKFLDMFHRLHGDWPTSGNLFIPIFFLFKGCRLLPKIHCILQQQVMYIQMFIQLLQACQTKRARRGQKHEEDASSNFGPLDTFCRVVFLTGPSKIFPSIRLHSKSHQKSSKCMNLPAGNLARTS